MNKSSDVMMEEAVSIVERLGGLLKGILAANEECISEGSIEIIEALESFSVETPAMETPAMEETVLEETVEDHSPMESAVVEETVKSNGQAKASKSDLVREFFNKHGDEVRNKDVVESIHREAGVEINPSLVSFLRGRESEVKRRVSARKETKIVTNRVVSGSSIIREYLTQHGLDSDNQGVVDHVKKTRGLNVRATLVSSVRADLKRKNIKTGRMRRFVGKKSGARKGPTMPKAVIYTLKKAGKGLELSEIAQKVMKLGYEYKGGKSIAGITQNVFQALNNLSKKIAHPGFKGNAPVVIRDKMPGQRVGRYRLNPKAKVA